MNLKIINVILVVAVISLFTALVVAKHNQPHQKRVTVQHKVEQPIHEYASHNSSSNDWLYYYIIFNNDSSTYYYSSPTRVTDFSNVRFEQTTSRETLPADIKDNLQTAQETEITTEVGQEVDVVETIDYSDTVGGAEAFDSGANNDMPDPGISSEPSSDSSSSFDSGSSDSGSSGGDSGGGE